MSYIAPLAALAVGGALKYFLSPYAEQSLNRNKRPGYYVTDSKTSDFQDTRGRFAKKRKHNYDNTPQPPSYSPAYSSSSSSRNLESVGSSAQSRTGTSSSVSMYPSSIRRRTSTHRRSRRPRKVARKIRFRNARRFKRRFGRFRFKRGRRSLGRGRLTRRGRPHTSKVRHRVLNSLMRPFLDGLHRYINTVNETKAPVGGAVFNLIAAVGSEFVNQNVTVGVSVGGTTGVTGHLSQIFRDGIYTSGETVFSVNNAIGGSGFAQLVTNGVPSSSDTVTSTNIKINIQSAYCVTKYKNNTNVPIFVEWYWYRPRRDLTNAAASSYDVLPVAGNDQATFGFNAGNTQPSYNSLNAPSDPANGFILFTPYHSSTWVANWKIVKKLRLQLEPGQIGQVYTKMPFSGEFSGRNLANDIRWFRKYSTLLMCKVHGSLADVINPAPGVDTTTLGPAQLDTINFYHYKFNRMPGVQSGNALDSSYSTLTHPLATNLGVACPPVQVFGITGDTAQPKQTN